MLRVWQKPLLNNKKIVQFDFATPGAHTQVLDAGTYDIWLVGGGGGGSLWRYPTGHTVLYTWADGGPGGVIHVRVNVPVQTTVTVNVAGTSVSRWTDGGVTSGDDGQSSSVVGLLNANVTAGGGTKGSVAGYGSMTRAQMGTNTASGANIKVIENNLENIIPEAGYGTNRSTPIKSNTNWPENRNIGRGGYCFPSNNPSPREGNAGFVRIRTSD